MPRRCRLMDSSAADAPASLVPKADVALQPAPEGGVAPASDTPAAHSEVGTSSGEAAVSPRAQDSTTAPAAHIPGLEPVAKAPPTPPELQSPEDHARSTIDAYDHLRAPVRKARAAMAATKQSAAVQTALAEQRPVHAEAAAAHGRVVPANYSRQGDLYAPGNEPVPADPGAQNAAQVLDKLALIQSKGGVLSKGNLAIAENARKTLDDARAKANEPLPTSGPIGPTRQRPPAPAAASTAQSFVTPTLASSLPWPTWRPPGTNSKPTTRRT